MIKRALLALCLSFVSVAAWAAYAPTLQYGYASPAIWSLDNVATAQAKMGQICSGGVYAEGSKSCTFIGMVTSTKYQYKSTCLRPTGLNGNCQAGTYVIGSDDVFTRYWCTGDNTAPNTSQPFASQCVSPPPPSCPIGQDARDWFPKNGKSSGFPVCQESGCTMTVSSVGTCIGLPSTGVTWCDMKGKLTGTTCNALSTNVDTTAYGNAQSASPGTGSRVDMPTTRAPNALPCPEGTVQGGIDSDGVPLCIGSGTAPANPPATPTVTTQPPVTVQNADGSSTTTQTSTQANADGSTTTTILKTIVAADGTKTVQQSSDTGNTPSGSAGKQDTPNTDQANLCKQNPQLAICKNSTVSGDCSGAAAAVVCTGDAIQCAQLQALKAAQCKQQQDDTDLKASSIFTKGSAVVAGNDPDKAGLPTVAGASQVAMPTSLNTSGWVGAGSPFDDVSFTVQGHSFVVPLNKWSSYLIALRYVLMVVASLVSFRMLSGAILKE